MRKIIISLLTIAIILGLLFLFACGQPHSGSSTNTNANIVNNNNSVLNNNNIPENFNSNININWNSLNFNFNAYNFNYNGFNLNGNAFMINITPTGPHSFSFSAPVTLVSITETANPSNTVWGILGTSGITNLSLGVLPAGWMEMIPANFVGGTNYTIGVTGPSGVGITTFTY